MDYEDIFDSPEAGGQNVNVRIGRALARPARSQARQKFRLSYFADK